MVCGDIDPGNIAWNKGLLADGTYTSVVSYGIHLRAIPQEVLKMSLFGTNLKISNLNYSCISHELKMCLSNLCMYINIVLYFLWDFFVWMMCHIVTHLGWDNMGAIFADNILKHILMNENIWISNIISLKYVP